MREIILSNVYPDIDTIRRMCVTCPPSHSQEEHSLTFYLGCSPPDPPPLLSVPLCEATPLGIPLPNFPPRNVPAEALSALCAKLLSHVGHGWCKHFHEGSLRLLHVRGASIVIESKGCHKSEWDSLWHFPGSCPAPGSLPLRVGALVINEK